MLKNNYLIKIIFIIILITLSILITGCSNNEGGLSQVSNYNVNFSVLDESDDPIEGATVTLVGSSKTTDSNGVVTFSKPDGSYDYNVIATGYDPLDGTAIVNGEDVSLNESLSISINTYNVVLSITDTNGDPIEGVTVSLEGENDQTTNSNGMITFSKQDGTYNYDVTATKYVDITNNSLTVSGADLTETVSMQDAPPAGYIGIYDWEDLYKIRTGLDENYILMNDLDSSTLGYNDYASNIANDDKGWSPIGNSTNKFRGTFDGNNFTISDLFINRPNDNNIGLFGYSTGEISNTNLTNLDISGYAHVGGITGYNLGKLDSNTTDVSISSKGSAVGGISGFNTGNISNCSSKGIITNDDANSNSFGGLVGTNGININEGTNGHIEDSYSIATVNTGDAGTYIGGLVGYNGSSIESCYAAGNVTGYSSCGGLIGYNSNSTLQNSYAVGSVTGYASIGGLIGYTFGDEIKNCYSRGEVTGTGSYIGGLIGRNYYNSTYGSSTITNSYYDSETARQSDTGKGSPRTTKQMQEGTLDSTIDGDPMYTSWETKIWDFGSDTDYPSLSWE